MNRNLLSVFVLVGFSFLAVFPAATRSVTDRVHVVARPGANKIKEAIERRPLPDLCQQIIFWSKPG